MLRPAALQFRVASCKALCDSEGSSDSAWRLVMSLVLAGQVLSAQSILTPAPP